MIIAMYLQPFLLKLKFMPERGKQSMRADIALFWFGVMEFMRSPNKYLYEPSSRVCRHSTGVLLLLLLCSVNIIHYDKYKALTGTYLWEDPKEGYHILWYHIVFF